MGVSGTASAISRGSARSRSRPSICWGELSKDPLVVLDRLPQPSPKLHSLAALLDPRGARLTDLLHEHLLPTTCSSCSRPADLRIDS